VRDRIKEEGRECMPEMLRMQGRISKYADIIRHEAIVKSADIMHRHNALVRNLPIPGVTAVTAYVNE
jgi:hypothetical protein